MTNFKWVGEGRAKLDFHKLSEIVIKGKINQVGVRNITQKENTRTNETTLSKITNLLIKASKINRT